MEKEEIQNIKTTIPEAQTAPQKVTHSSVQTPETPKKKPWLIIGLVALVLLFMGTTGFFAYQNYQLRQQVLQEQTVPLPEVTETPTPSPVPTINPQDDLTPTTVPSKEINYNLPSGWETIKDTNNQFEIGFNPNEFNASPYPARIGLNRKQCCFNFVMRIEPYDGGSRHSYLNQHFQGYESISNTYEKNYQMNGKSGLVIYNVEYSSTIVIGMINIDGNRAFVFGSTGGNEQQIEQILSTIKLLQ
jgi:hypothetical protein